VRSARSSALALSLALALAGCIGGGDESPAPSEGPYASLADRPCPEDSFLTWENFGDPFMRDWCTGCHSADLAADRRAMAPVEINLNHLDEVRAQMDLVWIRAADQNQTMPPAGGPHTLDRELLGEWLACGAPSRADL
jgi:hypothetical protein